MLRLAGSGGLRDRMATGHSWRSSITLDCSATLEIGPPVSTVNTWHASSASSTKLPYRIHIAMLLLVDK